MKAKDLEVGGQYILAWARASLWRDHVMFCARVTVVGKDLYNGGVAVDVERPGPDGFRPPERAEIRVMQIVAPWSEMAAVREREAARIAAGRTAERERLARHDMAAEVVGRLGSLPAEDVDVSWDGERVTLTLGAFLGMAGLAAKALS